MTSGFIIHEKFVKRIFAGKKTNEYRSFKTKKLNEPIFILSNGFCYGQIKFTNIKNSRHKKYKYAWKIKVIEKFLKPKKYKTKRGQQIWVKYVQFQH